MSYDYIPDLRGDYVILEVRHNGDTISLDEYPIIGWNLTGGIVSPITPVYVRKDALLKKCDGKVIDYRTGSKLQIFENKEAFTEHLRKE